MSETLWWITLGMGAVIILAVIAMLHTLLTAVRRIEDNVVGLWVTAKQLASNTATTWLLQKTPKIAAAVKEEALRHDALLTQGGDR